MTACGDCELKKKNETLVQPMVSLPYRYKMRQFHDPKQGLATKRQFERDYDVRRSQASVNDDIHQLINDLIGPDDFG